MSSDTQHLRYPDVIPRGSEADVLSGPILAADFKTIKVSLEADADADYDIVVYGSYNSITNPPDLSNASTVDNEYHLLGYTNEGDGVNYSAGSPLNPGGAMVLGLNVEQTGVTWVIVGIANWADGTVVFMNVDLFSNFN